MARLLDFVKARENPFIIHSPNVTLYNFLTNEIVADNVKARIVKVLEIGDAVYQTFRNEQYVVRFKSRVIPYLK